MEQGRLVDVFSSREIKRLLYMTERHIRYASAPALGDSAVYFKSGSLYSCKAEPGFKCKKYHGNVKNYMNSAAIVETPAGVTRLFYLATLISNVLYKNSALDHQPLATYIHRMIEADHPPQPIPPGQLPLEVTFSRNLIAFRPEQQERLQVAKAQAALSKLRFDLGKIDGKLGPKATDPKTTFIGRYKASLSVIQILLQLLFIYFFARLWLNGKVLYAYPLLLIPNLLFIIGVYVFRPVGYQTLIFWGTISACAINDLLKRVIFDSSYQLLMFSIPEKLCNAIRMYSKLFFKPVFVIGICAFFLIIPELDNPMVVYTILIIASLAAILPIISRIPERYVLSLRESVQRRNRIERVRESLINYQPNLILDQYKIARDHHSDKFNYLYLLNLIRNSYASELDEVLKDLLKH